MAHGTQKLDSRIPAVVTALQAAGFDPCIVRKIYSLLGATYQHSTTQSSYLNGSSVLKMAEKGE